MALRLLVLAVLVNFWPALSQAEDAALDRQAREIYGQIMSPYCPGRVLENCPSSAAAALKDKIRGMLDSGQTEEQVFSSLIAEFGEQIRAAPTTEGFAGMAYYMPLLFLLVGMGVIGFWLNSKKSAPQPQKSPAVDAETQARIDAELK